MVTTTTSDAVTTLKRQYLLLRVRQFFGYSTPEPLAHTRFFWIATALVSLFVALFSTFFILYLTGLHDAYLSNAEDLGIMDQAIWNTIHGQMLHQTICNTIGDTNCVGPGGVSRFAIHFEPVLFPLSLLYTLFPGPKTLIVVQTLVVASGAFPAFWLARLRLRSEWAGVAFAILYLLYPAQQQATAYDFHAVTFTTALLMFMLYFLYTRQTGWMVLMAVLSMACKEEIPGIIALCGLWSLIFQRRWRSGASLVVLALLWVGVAYAMMHWASPTGKPLLVSRYEDVAGSPAQFIHTLFFHPLVALKQYVFEHAHLIYLRMLLAPTGYIALLAPWILVLALPTLALNLISSNVQMYSGLYQYNAEIVPILVLATIEAVVLLCSILSLLVRWANSFYAKFSVSCFPSTSQVGRTNSSMRLFSRGILALLLVVVLVNVVRADIYHDGKMPFSQGFAWPQYSSHDALAQTFLDQIPPDASVSAQSNLVPHLSHRQHIYLFPYAKDSADYIFLDVTSDIYPFYSYTSYVRDAKKLLLSGEYGVVAAHDGYLLLKRGLYTPGLVSSASMSLASGLDASQLFPRLPRRFCSYVKSSPNVVEHPMQIVFSPQNDPHSRINLIGYSVGGSSTMSISASYLSVTTYWRLDEPVDMPMQLVVLMTDQYGHEHFVSSDIPSLYWCQTEQWKPGTVVRLNSRVFGLKGLGLPEGPSHLSLAVIPFNQPSDRIMDPRVRLPFQIIRSASGGETATMTKALPLMGLNLVS